jgi:hypothetical protein
MTKLSDSDTFVFSIYTPNELKIKSVRLKRDINRLVKKIEKTFYPKVVSYLEESCKEIEKLHQFNNFECVASRKKNPLLIGDYRGIMYASNLRALRDGLIETKKSIEKISNFINDKEYPNE